NKSTSIVASFFRRNLASTVYANLTKQHKLFLSRYFIFKPAEKNSGLIKGFDSFDLNQLKVTNLETGITTNYLTISQAANDLAISRKYLLEHLFLTGGENKAMFGKYIIT